MRLVLLFAALVLVYPAAAAPPPGGPPGWNKIRLAKSITLEPVRVSELFLGASTAVVFNGTDPIPALHNTMVQRELRDFWRMNIHPQGGAAPAIQVDYEITGDNGMKGYLSALASPTSLIQVTLEKLPLTLQVTPGVIMVQGGARFHMDVTAADRSGDYGGELLVTVNLF